MRRRAMLSFVLMLGLFVGIGAAPEPVAAQQCQGDAYLKPGPCEKIIGGDPIEIPPGNQQRAMMQIHPYTIQPSGFIPEAPANRQNPEAVVLAKVLTGSLIFRVGDEANVIVDPQSQQIAIVEPDPPVDAAHPLDSAHDYSRETGVVTDLRGNPCVTLCVIQPGDFVRLDAGYTVYLPGAVTCFWCNATDNDATLMVIAQSGFGFNGLVATEPGLHDARAWTVARNPGSPCH
ncbi:MAG TPA: hypothetical protein VFI22_14100 [Thermomicrobiales bacterium]|nr:hypothetical protein [Thermomicrobiales bacterium]